MAGLILEVTNRDGRQIHRLDQGVVRVGRAWDNDIIISDPTVSAYHFLIRPDKEGIPTVYSLADENGLQVHGQRTEGPIPLTQTPLAFDAGRSRVRVIDPAQAVAPTRLIGCHGGGICLLGSWRSAILLFLVFVLVSLVENYLATPQVLSWDSFGKDQVLIVAVALTLWAGLLLLTRLLAHRWDHAASLGMVSLLLLVSTGLDYLKAGTDYYFSTPAAAYIVDLGWSLMLLPLALAWFLIRLNHARPGITLVVLAALLSPFAYVDSRDLLKYSGWFDTFSKRAYYSQELSAWDLRYNKTLSISEFIDFAIEQQSLSQVNTKAVD